MELFVRISVVRFVKRQRIEVGSGPKRLKFERLIFVTAVFVLSSQVMPDQEHGVWSRLFQVEREEEGSSTESLNWYR
jgi:hypothetical protein